MNKVYSLLVFATLTAAPFSGKAQCGPTISCPSNISVSNDAGQCGAVVVYPAATASTSCSGTTTVFSETFNAGAGTWTLNTSTGTNGAQANTWIVSAAEGGVAPPGCGVANNGDNTLHITCTSMFCGSLITGAVYNASEATSKRAESPAFSTSGYSNLTLSFDYISLGDGLNDNASVLYNDGSGWITLVNSIKSTVCGGGQGTWTNYTVSLPASCNNNPNVKIGFNWVNNADNVGTDPSVAINNVSVTTAVTPSVNITYSQASGTFFPVGTTTVTATATDQNLNTASCNFLVTVSDTADPVISDCPANIIVTANAANCSAVVNWNAPATNDNCSSGLTLNSSHSSGSTFPLGTTAVTYTVTDGSGNTATCTFNVTVENNVSAAAVAVDALCFDGTGSLTCNVMTGTPGYTYSWSPAGGSAATTSAVTAGIYTCTVTDANGCTTTATDTVFQPNLISSAQNVSICEGEVFSIGTSSYSVAGTYNDTLVAQNGCDSIVTTNLSFLPLPVITASGTFGSSVCEGNQDTLFVTGGVNYQWSTNETNDTIFVTQSAGNSEWIVTGTDVNGCSSNDTVTTNVIMLVTISFDVNSIDTLCVDDGSVSLSTAAAPGGGQWSGTGVTGNSFSPNSAGSGTHALFYTYENSPGCNSTDSVEIYVDACTGIKFSKNAASVLVYPNPTKGTFTVDVNENFNIEVYNGIGQKVLAGKYASGKHKINLENEACGIYMVKIFKESGVKYVRVVKE